ncbi:MAG: serine/threonine protein kinase, partial [Polyangiaceae bacterium]|nr:serine/threonine protein kinase [Polyangiaceae bacterium]
MSRPTGSDLSGSTLDGYVLEAKIGSGATGVVYRARRGDEDKPVAVKVLNENLGQISSLRRRFEREARALSRLKHPRIVHISDFGITDEATFIAMEVLEGDTLEEILADGPVAPESAVAIVCQTLEGVGFAHEMQIVHRDLKPANIFLQFVGGKPDVKVLDFGLAKFLSVDELSEDATLTRKGRIVGTPAYMAPEQITGGALDVRADVYAAGVLLFELLADRRPFDYPRRSQLLRAHLFEPVPALATVRPGLTVHPALEAIVRKALSKDPAERFADAGAMLAA